MPEHSGFLRPVFQQIYPAAMTVTAVHGHRINTTMAWIERLRRLAPIAHLAQERDRFDMQLLLNPDISGVGYQQVTLAGYEASVWPGRAAPTADHRPDPIRAPPARWPSPRRRRAPAAARRAPNRHHLVPAADHRPGLNASIGKACTLLLNVCRRGSKLPFITTHLPNQQLPLNFDMVAPT